MAAAGLRHYYLSVSKKLKYVLAIVGTLFALILIAWSPWSALLYRGDGKFSDDLFLYPRYWVSFAEIPLNEPGEHHFHFRGMPNEEMRLILYVKGDLANWKNRNYLTSFPASIEAKMTDGKGDVVCHAFGDLLTQTWTVYGFSCPERM